MKPLLSTITGKQREIEKLVAAGHFETPLVHRASLVECQTKLGGLLKHYYRKEALVRELSRVPDIMDPLQWTCVPPSTNVANTPSAEQ
jgi:hypothetical protein